MMLWAVISKELRDGLRDRRSVLSALIYPLIGPLLVAMMLDKASEMRDTSEEIDLPLSGAAFAPALVHHMDRDGFHILPAPDDPEAAVRAHDVDMVLEIPADFEENLRKGQPNQVRLIADWSRKDRVTAYKRVEQCLESWSAELGAYRLLARGVDPKVIRPVMLDRVDLATPEQRADIWLSMVVMFMITAAFISNMYLAIDATAGERERRSLEPLLLNPVPRAVLVLGKWIATAAFGTAGMLLTLLCTVVALRMVPTADLGLRLLFDAPRIATAFAIALPLGLFAGALQLAISSFAHSFKEAQTYLSLTLLLPMIPGLAAVLVPSKIALWQMVVPVLAQQTLLGEVLGGRYVEPGWVAAATGSALLWTVLCLGFTTYLFSREDVLAR